MPYSPEQMSGYWRVLQINEISANNIKRNISGPPFKYASKILLLLIWIILNGVRFTKISIYKKAILALDKCINAE